MTEVYQHCVSATDFSLNTTRLAPLARSSPDWAGCPIMLCPLPAQDEITHVELSQPSMHMVCSGVGQRWLLQGQRERQLHTAPGMLEFQASGTVMDRARWDGSAGEVIVLQLPPERVARLCPEDGQAFDLLTQYEQFDPSLANLVHALWQEAKADAPNGALYVQGITLALIGILRLRYACCRPRESARIGQFGVRDVQRLREFIAAHLSEDLRIERLASLVSMGPDHFARRFKATFAQSPHAFVMQRRIDAALVALKSDRQASIADIAAQLGFCSQAHFTDVFRRKVGATPKRWRQEWF